MRVERRNARSGCASWPMTRLDLAQGEAWPSATASPGMTQDADKIRLSMAPLFSPMDPATLLDLERASHTRRFDRGEALEFEGQDFLIVLLSGVVALGVREADRGAMLLAFRAPSTLNLACVMARSACEIRWRALQGGAAIILPGQVFRDALARDPALAVRAFGELAIAHQQLLTAAASQRLRSAQTRVGDYLLSLTPEPEGAVVVRLPYGKHLLASLLGMTPENFSRAMGRLCVHGVTMRGGDVRIDRVERLRTALAGGPGQQDQ